MPFVAEMDIYKLVRFVGMPNPDHILVVEAEGGVELVFRAGFHSYPSWKWLVLAPDLSVGLSDEVKRLANDRGDVIASDLIIGQPGVLGKFPIIDDGWPTPVITGWRATTVQELQTSRRCGQ